MYTENTAFRSNSFVPEESTINFEIFLESETKKSFVFSPKVQSFKGLTNPTGLKIV